MWHEISVCNWNKNNVTYPHLCDYQNIIDIKLITEACITNSHVISPSMGERIVYACCHPFAFVDYTNDKIHNDTCGYDIWELGDVKCLYFFGHFKVIFQNWLYIEVIIYSMCLQIVLKTEYMDTNKKKRLRTSRGGMNYRAFSFVMLVLQHTKRGLPHFGPVMPYVDRDLDQHLLISWFIDTKHQIITWTNVDLPSKVFCGICLRSISQ